MSTLSDSHISEDDLELYCLGSCPGPELARVEEHLLWRHECLELAETADRFIAAIRGGVRRGGFEVELLAEEHRPQKGPS